MLASSSVQKPIRKLALARIRSSPSLLRQYRLARGGWRFYALKMAVGFGLLLIPVLLTIVPAAGGWQLTQCRDRVSGLGAITVAAFVAAVAALIHGSWLRRELTRSTSVALLGQLPIADRRYLRNRTMLSIGMTLVFLFVCLSYVGGALLSMKLGPAEMGALIGLGVVEWVMVASLTVLLPVWLPQVAREEVVGGMLLLALVLLGGGAIAWLLGIAQLPAGEVVLEILLAATPTGWPLRMMFDGVLQPQPGVWWFAVPTGVTVLAALASYAWLERRYVVREVTIENGMLGVAVGDRDWRLLKSPEEEDAAAEVAASPLAWLPRRSSRGDEDAELSPVEARDRVHAAEFLERDQWTSAGFVERLVASVLTDRERQAVEVMTGGGPSWTKSLMLSTTTSLAIVMLLLMADQAFQFRLIAMGGHVAFFGLIATLSGTWKAAIWKSSNGHTCPGMVLLPVSQSEVERLAMVLGVIRAFCLLPFAFGMTVMVTYGLTGRPEFVMSIYIGVKMVLVFAALHQWWFIAVQLNVASPFPSWAWLTDLLVGGICVILSIAGAVCLFVARQSEGWCLAANAVLFGGGWLAQRFQHRRILNEPTDFAGAQSGSFRLEQHMRRT